MNANDHRGLCYLSTSKVSLLVNPRKRRLVSIWLMNGSMISELVTETSNFLLDGSLQQVGGEPSSIALLIFGGLLQGAAHQLCLLRNWYYRCLYEKTHVGHLGAHDPGIMRIPHSCGRIKDGAQSARNGRFSRNHGRSPPYPCSCLCIFPHCPRNQPLKWKTWGISHWNSINNSSWYTPTFNEIILRESGNILTILTRDILRVLSVLGGDFDPGEDLQLAMHLW